MLAWLVLLAVGEPTVAAVSAPAVPVIAAVPALRDAPNNARLIDPARLALARELLRTTQTEETLDRMMAQLGSIFGPQVIAVLKAKPEVATSINQLIASLPGGEARLRVILNEDFLAAFRKRYPDLLDDLAREYALRFTPDELRQIIAFYSSGVGAKALRAIPELQQSMSLKGRALGTIAGSEAGVSGLERAEKEAAVQSKGSTHEH